MKTIVKLFAPPVAIIIIKSIMQKNAFWKGRYISWGEAQKNTSGYDSQNILEQVKESSLKVKNGTAAYERDSVIFDKTQYSWPLLAGLMYAAAKREGHLGVLDFGGSLGSSYYQNRKFLSGLKSTSWNIVEQPHFVSEGGCFRDGRLDFFEKASDCLLQKNPKVLLFSSVLQYLESPFEILESLLTHEFDVIILDRTPFLENKKAYVTVQNVPKKIYKASYPCWIFNEGELISFFRYRDYVVKETFISPEGQHNDFCFKGIILERTNA